jgi:hypothetical protein
LRESAMRLRANRLLVSVRLCNKGAASWRRRQKRKRKRRRKSNFTHRHQTTFDAYWLRNFGADFGGWKHPAAFLLRPACRDRRGEPSIFDATIPRLWWPLASVQARSVQNCSLLSGGRHTQIGNQSSRRNVSACSLAASIAAGQEHGRTIPLA